MRLVDEFGIWMIFFDGFVFLFDTDAVVDRWFV
jgi:hypothetical protein